MSPQVYDVDLRDTITIMHKHGESGFYFGHLTPEYRAWRNMKNRCYSPNSSSYKNYGARCITVCDKWLNNFPAFLADVGWRPSPDHSLDRLDNNNQYEPGNVRWATRLQQQNNQRLRKTNTSGFNGVCWDKARGKWSASITMRGKSQHLGRFFSLREAAQAVSKAKANYAQTYETLSYSDSIVTSSESI